MQGESASKSSAPWQAGIGAQRGNLPIVWGAGRFTEASRASSWEFEFGFLVQMLVCCMKSRTCASGSSWPKDYCFRTSCSLELK